MRAAYFNYYDDWKTATLECPQCGWKGPFEESMEDDVEDCLARRCPKCPFPAPTIAVVAFPTIAESRANWDKLPDHEKRHVEAIEAFQGSFEANKLRGADQLPQIRSKSFVLHWDQSDDDTVLRHGKKVIFREPAVYEGYWRFIEVAKILQARYGAALRDLVPTPASRGFLFGDKLSSPQTLGKVRKEMFPAGDKDA